MTNSSKYPPIAMATIATAGNDACVVVVVNVVGCKRMSNFKIKNPGIFRAMYCMYELN